jgi:hypothetical protein
MCNCLPPSRLETGVLVEAPEVPSLPLSEEQKLLLLKEDLIAGGERWA